MSSRRRRFLFWTTKSAREALGTSDSRSRARYWLQNYRFPVQFAEGGVEAVLNRKQRATPPVPRIFEGEKEAGLIALACSQPPEGRAKWTLRLLESKVVELNIVDHASDNTIGRVLKKTRSSLISRSNGSFRRKQAAHS